MHIPESIFKQARYDVPGADPDNPAPASATFAYDPMGNRTHFEDRHLPATTYSANALNQYTSISGSAPTYDLDGNLTRRNHQNLVWDAEKRLTKIQPIVAAQGDRRIEYAYDPTGRRVRKTVDLRDNGAWIEESDTHYTYWDWNVIEEHRDIAGASDETRRYFWGEDLSGSFQGAGGVGGLLAQEYGSTRWFYHYDGNGNVTELTDANGTTVASYRYTAFGKLRSSSGPDAEKNTYRFSTKPFDDMVACYYYGYRFYNPVMGRWLNRDPIGEDGGLNLYAMVGNDAVNQWDLLGLTDDECQKYYIGTCERSLAGRYINMPARFGKVEIPQSIRTRVERLINEDLGHHDVGFLIIDENDNQEVDLVIGFFADDFKEAGIGALKELASHLVPWETSWDNAGWVSGTIRSPLEHGSCSANQEFSKEDYEQRKSDAKSKISGYRAYHLFDSNCQHFASEF